MASFSYETRLNHSTKQATIRDANNNVIGTIQKTYDSLPKRIIDTLVFHNTFFRNYEIKDKIGNLRFKSIEKTPFVGKRVHEVTYFKDGEKIQFELRDKKSFEIGENIQFNYNGVNCYIEKLPTEPAKFFIKIAEWKVSIKPPFRTEVKLLNDGFKNDLFLMIGSLHTFFHIE